MIVSDIKIDNMKQRGFRFNDTGVPIVCAGPLSGKELRDNAPFPTYGMVLDGHQHDYRHDRSLYVRYPSRALIGNLVYTLTYVFDLDGFPVLREDGRDSDQVINEHWMTGTTWGKRLENLRQVSDEDRQRTVSWWKDAKKVYERTIGEIADLFLDPDRLEVQRAYVKAKMDALREQAPTPLRPKEESDSQAQPAVVVPDLQMVRAAPGVRLSPQSDGSVLAERDDAPLVRRNDLDTPGVGWLPKQYNGFQHPDPSKTVYPPGIERLALDRRKDVGATLRGWGSRTLGYETINDVVVEFTYISKRSRYEAKLTPKQLKRILQRGIDLTPVEEE